MTNNKTGAADMPEMPNLKDIFNRFRGDGNQEVGNFFKQSMFDTIHSSGEKGLRAIPLIIESSLAHKLIDQDKPCYQLNLPTKILNTSHKMVFDEIEALGLKLVLENRDADSDDYLYAISPEDYDESEDRSSVNKLFSGEDMIVNLSINKVRNNTNISGTILSLDKEKAEGLLHKLYEKCEDSVKSKDLHVVVKSPHGDYYLRGIGRPAEELVPENYAEDVVEDFRYIAEQLNSSTPSGRLVVLNGVAGTGKTYLLKALMKECTNKNTKIIYFQASLFKTLSAIDIIQLFLDESKKEDSATILFIEDGDECLLSRQLDNMNIISSLLNFADGLIGNLLDIKVVITTNAKKVEMDPALMRPGRLCKNVNVNKLNPTHSLKLFKKISGREPNEEEIKVLNKNLTLAEVYEAANK